MSESGEARCFDCGKTPETCWLPPHLCEHPDREGGKARNHEAEIEAVAQALAPWVTGRHGARMAARAALDAVRRAPQGEARNHEAEVEAVALWLAGEDGDLSDFPTNAGQARDYHMDRARDIIAALDAVRRSPQEDHDSNDER